MENKISVFFYKNTLLALSCIIIIVGMMSLWPFFSLERAYVFTGFADDSYTSYLPQWYVDEALSHEDGFLSTYSFYHAAGNSYVQNVPLDPVGFVMFWLGRLALAVAGVKGLAVMYFYGKFAVSFLGTGVFAYLWLRELNAGKFASMLAGIFAAFSGGIVVLSLWNIEMYGFYLAFYLYASEQMLNGRRRWLFAIAVAMLASQPYQLYLYSLFVAIYLIFRVIILKIGFRRLASTFLWILGMGLAGMLINLPTLVNSLSIQLNTPRMTGANEVNTFASTFFVDGSMLSSIVLRLFGHNIAGNEFFINSWNNLLEAPALYCGILTLLIFPQIFSHLSRRNIIAYSLFIGLWLLVIFVNPLRQAIVLGAGDYFRYGIDFFFIFAMLMVMAKSLDVIVAKRRVNVPLLLADSVIMGLLLWVYSGKSSVYTGSNAIEWIAYFAIMILVADTLLLVFISNCNNRQFIRISLCLIALLEVFVLTYSVFDGRSSIYLSDIDINRAGYADGGIDNTIREIRQSDSTLFYRMACDYIPGQSRNQSPNYNQVLGTFSTLGYNSFNQPEYVKFLQATGQSYPELESDSRWLQGANPNVFSQSFMGVKYMISSNLDTSSINPVLRLISDRWRSGNYIVTRFSTSMPLGFALDSYITESEFRRLLTFRVDERHFEFVRKRIQDAGLSIVPEVDVSLRNLLGKTFVDYQEIKDILYSGMPASHAYWASAALYLVSHEASLQSLSLLGSFAAGDDSGIDLSKYRKLNVDEAYPASFFASSDVYGMFDSIVKLNHSQSLEISSFANNHIKGSISVSGNRLLVLTIPFDKAWRVKVDGVDSMLKKCDVGFSGIELGAGRHDIELTYVPLYRNAAIWISIIAALIFYSFVVWNIKAASSWKALPKA